LQSVCVNDLFRHILEGVRATAFTILPVISPSTLSIPSLSAPLVLT
jgi:hypothetical protein